MFLERRFHATPGIVQPALALEPRREAQLRMDGIRVRGHRAQKTGPRIIQAPEPMILLAGQDQQRNIPGREFDHRLKSVVCLQKFQRADRGHAPLEPKLWNARIPAQQVPISLQRGEIAARQEMLLRTLPPRNFLWVPP